MLCGPSCVGHQPEAEGEAVLLREQHGSSDSASLAAAAARLCCAAGRSPTCRRSLVADIRPQIQNIRGGGAAGGIPQAAPAGPGVQGGRRDRLVRGRLQRRRGAHHQGQSLHRAGGHLPVGPGECVHLEGLPARLLLPASLHRGGGPGGPEAARGEPQLLPVQLHL